MHQNGVGLQGNRRVDQRRAGGDASNDAADVRAPFHLQAIRAVILKPAGAPARCPEPEASLRCIAPPPEGIRSEAQKDIKKPALAQAVFRQARQMPGQLGCQADVTSCRPYRPCRPCRHPGQPACLPGSSAIMQSVVSIRPAMEAAFCSAGAGDLVGSSTPISTMSPYSPLAAL